MQYLELDFHKLEYFFFLNCEKSISRVQHTIFISAGSPFHTLNTEVRTVQVYIIILYFYDYKVNRSTKCDFYTFQKIIKKKGLPKKILQTPVFHN